jgi:hypothetical protein
MILVRLAGVSPTVGMAIADAVGTFVGIDPLHLFWLVQAAPPAMKMRETALPVSGAIQTQV